MGVAKKFLPFSNACASHIVQKESTSECLTLHKKLSFSLRISSFFVQCNKAMVVRKFTEYFSMCFSETLCLLLLSLNLYQNLVLAFPTHGVSSSTLHSKGAALFPSHNLKYHFEWSSIAGFRCKNCSWTYSVTH